MFNKVHHIAVICTDYEKAKHFYIDLLGFSVIAENYREQTKDYKIDLVCGIVQIELFIKPDAPKRVSSPEACGLRHLAFHVDDVEKTVNELKSKGIDCEEVRLDTFTGKKMTFFRDPDLLPIEIHE
ncbi:MAG: VOC family protein [Succinivibrio sp.]